MSPPTIRITVARTAATLLPVPRTDILLELMAQSLPQNSAAGDTRRAGLLTELCPTELCPTDRVQPAPSIREGSCAAPGGSGYRARVARALLLRCRGGV